ncbi:MAG: hypothetical protein IT307_12000 [Chloroflexi bacterium]|nr:hypothetical protein [Chloroflexota bacterium]
MRDPIRRPRPGDHGLRARSTITVLLVAGSYGLAILVGSIGALYFLFDVLDGGFSWPGLVAIVATAIVVLGIHRWIGWAPFGR